MIPDQCVHTCQQTCETRTVSFCLTLKDEKWFLTKFNKQLCSAENSAEHNCLLNVVHLPCCCWEIFNGFHNWKNYYGTIFLFHLRNIRWRIEKLSRQSNCQIFQYIVKDRNKLRAVGMKEIYVKFILNSNPTKTQLPICFLSSCTVYSNDTGLICENFLYSPQNLKTLHHCPSVAILPEWLLYNTEGQYCRKWSLSNTLFILCDVLQT